MRLFEMTKLKINNVLFNFFLIEKKKFYFMFLIATSLHCTKNSKYVCDALNCD